LLFIKNKKAKTFMSVVNSITRKDQNTPVKPRLIYWSNPGERLGGLVLLGLGAWLLFRLGDGTLSFYIHPRFNILIALTGLCIVFVGGWLALWYKPAEREKKSLRLGLELISGVILVAVVALVGLFVAPRPLDNSRLNLTSNKSGVAISAGSSNRALAQALLNQDWKDTSKLDTTKWNLLDWSAALNEPQRAESLLGRPSDVVGFVVQPKGENSRYFLLTRYVVVCCTADSSALKIPVISDNAQTLEDGQWVRVRGVLGKSANETIAFVGSSVDVIPRPTQPYIFP
jgi:uncharacterized repeat protein (TIGR03943 family)